MCRQAVLFPTGHCNMCFACLFGMRDSISGCGIASPIAWRVLHQVAGLYRLITVDQVIQRAKRVISTTKDACPGFDWGYKPRLKPRQQNPDKKYTEKELEGMGNVQQFSFFDQ